MESAGKRSSLKRPAEINIFQNANKKRRRVQFILPKKGYVVSPQDTLVNRDFGKIKVEEVAAVVPIKREKINNSLTDIHSTRMGVAAESSINMPKSNEVTINLGSVDIAAVKAETVNFIKEDTHSQEGLNFDTELIEPSLPLIVSVSGSVTRKPVAPPLDLKQEETEMIKQERDRLLKETELLKKTIRKKEREIFKLQALKETAVETVSSQVVDFKTESNNTTDKVTALVAQVLEVYWNEYALRQKNPRQLLNLNCRLVCTGWKKGVDKILVGRSSPIKIRDSISIDIQTEGCQVLEDMVNKMVQSNNKSCMPPRSLDIMEAEQAMTIDKIGRSRKSVRKLLTEFGGGFNEFYHWGEVQRHYTSLADWYSTIRSWITMMPHLEELQLHYSRQHDTKEDPDIQEYLEETLRSLPFPKLERLRRFSEFNLPPCVLPSVLQNNSHIETLSIKLSSPLQPILLSQLRSLEVVVHSEHVDQLPTLRDLTAPMLECLQISVFSAANQRYLDYIFLLVEKFQETLKQLDLKLSSHYINYSIDLIVPSKITKLSLCLDAHNHIVPSNTTTPDRDSRKKSNDRSKMMLWNEKRLIEMASNFKSLEQLSISNFNIGKLDMDGIINAKSPKLQLKKYVRNELVSKLWELLPSLKKVEVQVFYQINGRELATQLCYIRTTGFVRF